MGIERGDFLLAINNGEVRDILDYRFRVQAEQLLVEVEKPCGEIWELDIEKDADTDLGLEFVQALMSNTRRCRNKCIFCFIDQQPPGLRDTLYVKDDDVRLSFLLGNYVTLTNLDLDEVRRLAGYHLSPLRISVHAAELSVREKMMGTPAACNLFDALAIFDAAGVEMHFQVVLCKGVNDGAVLDDTIRRLKTIGANAKSLAIVPAGLTKHRFGLAELDQFGRDDARTVINQVGDVGSEFVYLSDEWYILAGLPLPGYAKYDNFPQLDNGVGVLRLFEREFLQQLRKCIRCGRHKSGGARHFGIVTGTAAGGFMRYIANRFMAVFPHLKITVYVVRNDFFGSSVTVSGLLTGCDIIGQLGGKISNMDAIFLPDNAFRAGVRERIMLDGTTLQDLRCVLGVPVRVGSTSGGEFCKQLLRSFSSHSRP